MLYAFILLLLGIGLIILEILLPSGGLISIFSACALIGSLMLAFMESTAMGLVFLVAMIISLPMALIFGFNILPQTAIGRKFILTPKVGSSSQRGAAGVTDKNYSDLKGKFGRTVTPLRPSGIAEIEGERYSVVSEGDMIEDDTEIEVLEIVGNSIVVDTKQG